MIHRDGCMVVGVAGGGVCAACCGWGACMQGEPKQLDSALKAYVLSKTLNATCVEDLNDNAIHAGMINEYEMQLLKQQQSSEQQGGDGQP